MVSDKGRQNDLYHLVVYCLVKGLRELQNVIYSYPTDDPSEMVPVLILPLENTGLVSIEEWYGELVVSTSRLSSDYLRPERLISDFNT